MTSEKKLEPPTRNEKRAALRRSIEALAQATPVTAALAHLYGYTHPSQFEQDLERFWNEISALVNNHEDRLQRLEAKLEPSIVLSSLALEVLTWLLSSNTTGRSEPVMFQGIVDAFTGIDRRDLEESVSELAHLGYATKSSAIGHPIRSVRLTTDAFLGFDMAATGNDTRADAIHVAGLWVEDERLTSIYALKDHLGWEPRRLNPAIAVLLPIFPKGRRSGEQHPQFITTSVLVTSDERYQLRRVIETGRVD
ncbi:hypothetical protein JL101_004735 [Skermanella rosea]|uniref:hypothetical protein n=1 Tax=Skermanella rosea TaxID=1817965 RepID=UPI001931A255|nr:hypothetical protein [Skermanella rosea]UEM04752.1 hypothetical protein JL101_004735 [Skermanella rosea]